MAISAQRMCRLSLTVCLPFARTFSFIEGSLKTIRGHLCIHTSARTNKVWEVPSSVEASSLKKIYSNPMCLIHDLLKPLVSCGMTAAPQLVLAPRLDGRFWRAKLRLQWPSKVTIFAVHSTVTGAEENAYLLACDLFKNMGLLYQPTLGCVQPVSQDYVMTLLHTLHTSSLDPFVRARPRFHFCTTPAEWTRTSNVFTFDGHRDGAWQGVKGQWLTDISASWPYPFSVRCIGPSWQASQYAAVLQTCIKLKAMGLLSNNNQLAQSRLQGISRRCRSLAWAEGKHICKDFDADFQIFSDASAFGFGAYLVRKDDDCVHWLASAWSEHFPGCHRINPRHTNREQAGNTILLDSTFCELYSLVTAFFTWKHKFVGRRVLMWSDNHSAVQLVNLGVHREASRKRFGKLFHILMATCDNYSIELQACHIQRAENMAADLLSRLDLTAFKEAVPEAASSKKKTKKLWFWNPLQSAETYHQLKFM